MIYPLYSPVYIDRAVYSRVAYKGIFRHKYLILFVFNLDIYLYIMIDYIVAEL